MIPTYYEGIPVVTIYYVVTRAILLACCAKTIAVRVWHGNWHVGPDEDRFSVIWIALFSLAPAVGELISALMFGEMLKDVSKRRALSIRAEESRQHPEAGQLTIKDDAP